MKRGSVVVAVGCCVLAFFSAGAGLWVNQLDASQRPDRDGASASRRPVTAEAFTGQSFSPVEPAVTQQVIIEADRSSDQGKPLFEPIAIPTPTAGFAGLALLGILLTRRRAADVDTRAL
ncbi:MAG: hypothetical protein ACE37H_10795 [Phycisphaeraceae bacterium]